MARVEEVIIFLQPNAEFVCRGENYESIEWLNNSQKISKTQFEAGFAKYDSWKAKEDLAKATARAELLAKLGITAEEAALLLS